MKTSRHWLHALRATLKLASLVALFAALVNAPLATVTAIGFAAPLFVTVGAWIFFGERPRSVRVAGALLGFFGIVVLLRPDGSEMNVVLFYALISALLVGTIQLILKHMGKTEDADTLVAWNLIITVPIGPAFYFWATPTATEWILLALQGVLGAVNQFTATKAFQYADASLVAPIDFVRLPFVAAAAYFIFGEVADRATRIGASLIFIAVLLIAATFTIVLSEELDIVDPCEASRSNVGRVVLQNVSETMTELVPGKGLQSRLADSWSDQGDGTWRFNLHPGVMIKDETILCEIGAKFFGGIELSANVVDDVTIDITADPASPILPLLIADPQDRVA
eukprot:gene22897-35094_t